MSETGGWFSISRKLFENPIFKGRADRMGVWVWLVGNAAYQDCQQDVAGKMVTIRRGQLCASQAMICKETGVSRQDLRSLLMALTRSGAICVERVQNLTKGRTIITICNYEKYQSVPQAANQAATKQQPTKEQGNNLSGSYEPDAAELKDWVWAYGAKQLGIKRSLLGKWISEHGEAEVMSALLASDGKADRVAWITARLKRGNRREVTTDEYLARQGIRDVTDDERNFSRGGDTGPPPLRHPANDMPGMQPDAEEEARPMPERDVRAGEGAGPLLALRMVVGGV